MKKFNTKRLVEDALMLAILIVSAYISLPISTVLFTFQVLVLFVIFLRLPLLDSILVTVTYAIMGLIGLPVFSGGSSGIGPTTGYIIGFVISSIAIGFLKNVIKTKYPMLNNMILCLITIIIYDIFGSIFFYLYMDTSYVYALEVTVVPFIFLDITKAFIASYIVKKLNNIIIDD